MIRLRPPFPRLVTRDPRQPCRFWAESPLGRADKQPLPLPLHRLLLIMASGPTGPLVHPQGVIILRHESYGRDRLFEDFPPPPDILSATTADWDACCRITVRGFRRALFSR